MLSFAAIPPYVEHLLTGSGRPLPGLPDRADRVVVILLDAFGRVFRERFARHPLIRRLDVCELDSQFPSTTAAHVTTMHSGLPVEQHGVYEWNVLEPSLGRIVTPLRFAFAGDADADTLRGHLDPRVLVPDAPCLYERLAGAGVACSVHQPDAFSPSTFDSAVVRGADVRPYGRLGDGLTDALRAVRAADRAYAYVYFHGIDLVGHVSGPSSPDFAAAARLALDTVEAALTAAGDDVLVLLTADHGQVDVDPAVTLWLDDLHPPLRHLALRPAGSARDVFLHVDDVEGTLAALAPHVEVHRTADLLPDAGPRLRARLADLCVLPPPGRMAWLRTAADHGVSFRGHHGGRTPEETATYLAAVTR